MTHPVKLNENTPLSDLAAAARRLNQAIAGYTRSALRVSLDLGDVLALARGRVAARRWKTWRIEHCPGISERRDVVYRQLAACRSIIERELEKDSDLSIRDALKLIATPKPRSPKPQPTTLEKWRTLSAAEKCEGLRADGSDAFRKYMPSEWLNELADQVARVKHKTVRDRGLSARLREYIEQHSEEPLAKYVRSQAIDLKHLVVHVGAIDAPSKRRPPLVMHAGSTAHH
jgi:hypothetical protein